MHWAAMTAVLAAGPAGGAQVDPPGRAYEGPREVVPDGPEVPAGAVPPPRSSTVPAPEPPPDRYDETGVEPMAREISVEPRRPPQQQPERAGTVVTRKELDERLPRSAPDALRYEPGVYVQQTAHAQASPFVRGMTGQQVVLMFDDIRLNNSTFRQGPNQYFFTVDSHTIQQLEVIRGSASTRYGSGALGGAVLSTPIEPSLDTGKRKVVAHPRGILRMATADGEIGGRAQLDLAYRGKLGLFGGVGYRDVGELKSGGPITAPATGEQEKSPPAFREDEKTQRGTGFRELTADARAVWQARPKHRFTLGYYDYRQLDAPRTDLCPPQEAPEDVCATYLEQFRTMVYGAYLAERGPAGARRARLTVSYQNQHELQQEDRGEAAATTLNWLDDVHVVGTGVRLRTKTFEPTDWLELELHYGADAYADFISSDYWLHFLSTDVISVQERARYRDGARYVTSGLWSDLRTTWWDVLGVHAGGRFAYVHAHAPPDDRPELSRSFPGGTGSGGLSLQVVEWLRLLSNVNQGFRAPNLDDLAARGRTSRGYQIDNPDLSPERSLTVEAGAKVHHARVALEGWYFQTWLRDFNFTRPLDADACPEADTACMDARRPVRLEDADGLMRGVDGSLRVYIPYDLEARTTLSWVWGERERVEGAPGAVRVPTSKAPPLNGTVEAGWRSTALGVYAIGALRWATLQDRLAPADEIDARIPEGGTPGYAVVDLRVGYRQDPYLLLGLVFENVGNAAYRIHGSSLNGPGRGLRIDLQLGF